MKRVLSLFSHMRTAVQCAIRSPALSHLMFTSIYVHNAFQCNENCASRKNLRRSGNNISITEAVDKPESPGILLRVERALDV